MDNYTLKIQFLDPTGSVLKDSALFLPAKDLLDNGNIVQAVIAYAESLVLDENPGSPEGVEGKVVTPLPPEKLKDGKIEGLVTPKAPLQVAREQEQRLSDLPDELKNS